MWCIIHPFAICPPRFLCSDSCFEEKGKLNKLTFVHFSRLTILKRPFYHSGANGKTAKKPSRKRFKTAKLPWYQNLWVFEVVMGSGFSRVAIVRVLDIDLFYSFSFSFFFFFLLQFFSSFFCGGGPFHLIITRVTSFKSNHYKNLGTNWLGGRGG